MKKVRLLMTATFILWGTSQIHAAVIIAPGGGAGVTTDILDAAQGARIDETASTANPIFAYERAIGVTGVGGETTNAIFSNTGAAGTTQSFVVRTPRPITLDQFQLLLSQDGASSNRSATSVRVYASNDNVNYVEISDTTDVTPSLSNYQTNFGSGAITVSDTPNVTAQFFRVETIKATGPGPRIREFDGFGSFVPLNINGDIFNAVSNSGLDEAAGLSFGFNVSSAVLGSDTPQDAFGNNNGFVEPTTFIFGDGGALDNGNGIFGDGGETVDFIEWQTLLPIDLAGFEINLGGDGGGANRGTELVRFLVEGIEVDLFDNNHLNGSISRLFSGGPMTGDDFRIEFTISSVSGPRIIEINAILPTAVPEPATIVLMAMALLASGLYRLRRRSGEKAVPSR